jgi:hypothetical protein
LGANEEVIFESSLLRFYLFHSLISQYLSIFGVDLPLSLVHFPSEVMIICYIFFFFFWLCLDSGVLPCCSLLFRFHFQLSRHTQLICSNCGFELKKQRKSGKTRSMNTTHANKTKQNKTYSVFDFIVLSFIHSSSFRPIIFWLGVFFFFSK